MVSKSYYQLSVFLPVTNKYRERFDKEGKPVQNPPIETKLDYAIDVVVTRIKKAITENKCEQAYADRLRHIEIENTLINKETKSVLRDAEGRYQHSKEQLAIITDENRKALNQLNSTEISFEPYFATSVPDNLSIEQVEVFKGIVLNENYEIKEPLN